MKTVYLFDATGAYIGTYDAQESPLEPGVFITPVLSTSSAPPEVLPNQVAVFNGSSWAVQQIPEPEPEIAPPVPPISVTPWQIRKALLAVGLLDTVEAEVAVSGRVTQLGWQYATEFVRTNPLVEELGESLGKSEAELDAIFTLAKSL